MHNYYPDIVWKMNIVLAAGVILTATAIFLCVLYQNIVWLNRNRRLLVLKGNIYGLVLARAKTCPGINQTFIDRSTPRDFIDIETNRLKGAVFFNEEEQSLFRNCFIRPDRIAKLEKMARFSISKWRRIEAMLCLGYAGTESVVNIAGKSLLNKDEDIAYFSIIALGQIKSIQSARALLGVLRKDVSHSYKIASVLEQFPPEITSEIVKLMDDERPFVRCWALTLLTKFAPANHIKIIEKLTYDGVAEVRAAACLCLGSIAREEAVHELERCLGDDSWLVRVNGITALEKVLGSASVGKIIRLINDGSWSVIEAIKNVMTAHIDVSLPYIEKFFAGEDEIAKRASVLALEDSGYLAILLRKILSGEEKSQAGRLLEGVVKSNFHFGLEAAIGNFDPDAQVKLIEVIGRMDKPLSEHIDMRIKGLVEEE